jgi:hypothetical protein
MWAIFFKLLIGVECKQKIRLFRLNVFLNFFKILYFSFTFIKGLFDIIKAYKSFIFVLNDLNILGRGSIPTAFIYPFIFILSSNGRTSIDVSSVKSLYVSIIFFNEFKLTKKASRVGFVSAITVFSSLVSIDFLLSLTAFLASFCLTRDWSLVSFSWSSIESIFVGPVDFDSFKKLMQTYKKLPDNATIDDLSSKDQIKMKGFKKALGISGQTKLFKTLRKKLL